MKKTFLTPQATVFTPREFLEKYPALKDSVMMRFIKLLSGATITVAGTSDNPQYIVDYKMSNGRPRSASPEPWWQERATFDASGNIIDGNANVITFCQLNTPLPRRPQIQDITEDTTIPADSELAQFLATHPDATVNHYGTEGYIVAYYLPLANSPQHTIRSFMLFDKHGKTTARAKSAAFQSAQNKIKPKNTIQFGKEYD